MEQNWSEQIMSIINQIAEKLGVAAEKMYPILIKQAMIEGIYNVIIAIFMIGIFVLLYQAIKYCYFKKDKYGNAISYNWDASHFGFWVTWIIAFVVSTAVLLNSIYYAIVAFINPDWYIINNILKQLIS